MLCVCLAAITRRAYPRDSLTLKKNFIRKNRKGARARLRRFARPDENAVFGISMRRRFERVVESARPLKIETSLAAPAIRGGLERRQMRPGAEAA